MQTPQTTPVRNDELRIPSIRCMRAAALDPQPSHIIYVWHPRCLWCQGGPLEGEIQGKGQKPAALIAHFEYRRSATARPTPATSSDFLTVMKGIHVAGDDGDVYHREKARPQVSQALIGNYECTTTECSTGPPTKPNTRACMSSVMTAHLSWCLSGRERAPEEIGSPARGGKKTRECSLLRWRRL
jgi:hypothetical protein